MPVKRITGILLAPLLTAIAGGATGSELATLFTTPAERQIIDTNRYKRDDAERPVAPVQAEIERPVQQLVREEVTREYTISGITVSPDGAHSVWINSTLYEDGAVLEDRSRVKIIVGRDVRVRITTPDGKQYFATSGEKLQVSYLAPIEN